MQKAQVKIQREWTDTESACETQQCLSVLEVI